MTGRLAAAVLLTCIATAGGQDARTPFPKPFDTQPVEAGKELSPAEKVVRETKLPEGFSMTLCAAEPDVQQPIAMAMDGRGRVWVAENYTYAESKVNYDMRLRDRILVFEDTDHDGKFDKRTVFAEGLTKLTSIEIGMGGVYALCAPKLVFIPDKDGDDRPDGDAVTLLEGWNDGPVRHNIVNGLRWGPDGWLYGRHGIMASSKVGKPGTSDAERVPLNACIWRYHPVTAKFEVLAHGTTNPWGYDWDEHGQLFFINVVIGHLWHMVPGAHYRRMYGEDLNPHVYQLLEQTGDHFHWDTGRQWHEERTAEGKTDALGGGHAHAGCMIYLGDNWPQQYRNTLFTLNLHGKRLNNDAIVRQGAGYVGKHRPDFARIADPWFRGIELMYGPDGGVYVLDWSDIGECHENDGVHRSSGRIYKIVYGKPQKPAVADVAKLSDDELVKLQLHRNEWYVRQARRALRDRAAAGKDLTEARRTLRQMWETETDVPKKLRAMWALHCTGGNENVRSATSALTHESEHVRAWGIRLLVEKGIAPVGAGGPLVGMAQRDPSGLVLLYLASTLQQIPVDRRMDLATALARRAEFADDPVLPLMVWYGIEPAVPRDPAKATELLAAAKMATVRKFIARRLTGELEADPAAVASLVKALDAASSDDVRRDVLEGMSMALRGWRKAPAPAGWNEASAKLASSNDEVVKRLATELSAVFGDGRALDDLRKVAANKQEDLETRRQAIRILVESRAEDLMPLLGELIHENDLAPAVARAMGSVGDPASIKLLIDKHPWLGHQGKLEIVRALTSRPEWAKQMLLAVAEKRIKREDIPAYQIRQMRGFGDAEIDARLDALWPELKDVGADKGAVALKFKRTLTPDVLAKADVHNGRAVWDRTCASCHTLFGEGGKIGPDITGSDRKNVDYLLENMLDPSALVPEMYRLSVIRLKNGEVVDGIVVEQTPRTVTVQTPADRMSVERASIASMKQSEMSMMPEGLLEGLKEDEARDLIAYLMSTRQVQAKR